MTVRRLGVVYAVDLLDHESGTVRTADYVGQTRQLLRVRGNQHRDCQPWEDLIVGDLYVIEQGMYTDAELDAAELRLIRQLLPRMNWVGNEANPEQIPKWVQRDQRWMRDDATGRPRWVPLPERAGREAPARRRTVAGRRRWLATWGRLAGVWLLLAIAAGFCLTAVGLASALPPAVLVWTAALSAGVVVGWARRRLPLLRNLR